jgi:hypothetical protein
MPFQGDAKTILSITTRVFDLVDGFFMDGEAYTKTVALLSVITRKLLSCDFLLLSFD